MNELQTTLLVYLVAHMWWLTYRIGRVEGEIKKINGRE